jgi:hypothetical protein
MAELTVNELVAQGYTREHAEAYIAMLSAPPPPPPPEPQPRPPTAQVRRWARAQGLPIGEFGRIPAEITAAYLAQG